MSKKLTAKMTSKTPKAAMPEPNGFASWNPAMRGAYRKGYEAAMAGKSAGTCPYEDKRKGSGQLTWSRAFMAAWHDGWNAGRQQDQVNAYYADRANSGLAARAQ